MGIKIIKTSSRSKTPNDRQFKLFLISEKMGIFFVFTAAVFLHFIYDWSGQQTWAVMFGAVNESTWEHIKIFALPYVIWGFIELFCIENLPFRKFVAAKTVGLYSLMISIPVFFYSYSTLLGDNILWVDISSGFLLTALSFYISFKVFTRAKNPEKFFGLSLFLLILYYLMFGFFTTAPPKIFLFQDPVNGFYGIPPRSY